jgi:hypothetical protein
MSSGVSALGSLSSQMNGAPTAVLAAGSTAVGGASVAVAQAASATAASAVAQTGALLGSLQATSAQFRSVSSAASQVVGNVSAAQLAELISTFETSQASLSSLIGAEAAARLKSSGSIADAIALWQSLAGQATGLTGSAVASVSALVGAVGARVKGNLTLAESAVSSLASNVSAWAEGVVTNATTFLGTQTPLLEGLSGTMGVLLAEEGQLYGNLSQTQAEVASQVSSLELGGGGAGDADINEKFDSWLTSFQTAFNADLKAYQSFLATPASPTSVVGR